VIFLTYDFVWFVLLFLIAYVLMPWRKARLVLLIASGLWFQAFYGGFASLSVVLVLATIAYAAGCTNNRIVIRIAIAASVLTLLYFKYMLFLASSRWTPHTTPSHNPPTTIAAEVQ
jgi:hypothetical protein